MSPASRTRSKAAARGLTKIVERRADKTPGLDPAAAAPRKKALRAVDPVREVIKEVKAAGVAISKIIDAMNCAEQTKSKGAYPIQVTGKSLRKSKAVIYEFSTSSPGHKQTILLLFIDDQAYWQIPGSAELAQKLRRLCRPTRRPSTVRSSRSIKK